VHRDVGDLESHALEVVVYYAGIVAQHPPELPVAVSTQPEKIMSHFCIGPHYGQVLCQTLVLMVEFYQNEVLWIATKGRGSHS
jgi:hypothetical protein